MIFSCQAGIPSLKLEGKNYPLLDRAQRHTSELVQMPFSFFSRLREEHPELLSYNINSLLQYCDSTTPRLIRTLNGKCRCIASNKYKLLEHENVLKSIAPLVDKYRLEVASCSIDDDRMRVKLISRKTKSTPVVGTTVCFGVFIQNSENTASSLNCTPFAEKLQCTNGLVLPQYFATTRKIHRGAAIWDLDDYTMPDMDYIGCVFARVS